MSEMFHDKHDVSLGTGVTLRHQAAGRRRYAQHDPAICCRCLKNPVRAPGQRYCRECHNISALASYHRRQTELARLRALEQQLSKGKDHGQDERTGGAPPADEMQSGINTKL